MAIEVGSVVEGIVTGITNFGAFVELPEKKVGLVHISEVADVYVKDVHDFLSENQKVKVKVLSIDDKGKIGLSIKALEENKYQPKVVRTNRENMLPRIGPTMVSGIVRQYGKQTSAIPPKNMMITAPGADFFAILLPNIANAAARPTHAAPLASTRNRTDFPVSAACCRPSGVIMPWLMAFFRNRISAGCTNSSDSGSMLWSVRYCTPAVRTS